MCALSIWYFPAQTHALCPSECHHVSLHVADNEDINMYIPSQVNACLALQFHGPSLRSKRFLQHQQPVISFYQMKKEKYSPELLNRYMTDRLADETVEGR